MVISATKWSFQSAAGIPPARQQRKGALPPSAGLSRRPAKYLAKETKVLNPIRRLYRIPKVLNPIRRLYP